MVAVPFFPSLYPSPSLFPPLLSLHTLEEFMSLQILAGSPFLRFLLQAAPDHPFETTAEFNTTLTATVVAGKEKRSKVRLEPRAEEPRVEGCQLCV